MKVESPKKSPCKNILVKKAEVDVAPKKGLLNFFSKKSKADEPILEEKEPSEKS